MDVVLKGQGRLVTTAVIGPEWAQYDDLNPYAYDPEQAKALLVNYGASGDAFLDIVFGADGYEPLGSLPFDLPRSDEAVAQSKGDVPFYTVDPVFRYGHGLRYEGC